MRIENHFDSTGSIWTKKYKPINIYQIIPDCDKYDEDKYTKIYMEKFGIDNVRGGSFSQINLSKVTKKFIQRCIDTSNDICYICSQSGHFVKDCPDNYNNIIHYRCDYCNKFCHNKDFLINHLIKKCKKNPNVFSEEIIEEKKEYINCEYCNQKFNNKSENNKSSKKLL